MLAVPIVISIVLLILCYYLNLDEKVVFACIVTCWVTYFGSCIWDIVGIQMGWWFPEPVN